MLAVRREERETKRDQIPQGVGSEQIDCFLLYVSPLPHIISWSSCDACFYPIGNLFETKVFEDPTD